MTRPLRSGIRRQFVALAALVLYFVLVMASWSDSMDADSKASVLWTLAGAALAYGVGYLAFPLIERLIANLGGKPAGKHRSRH